MTRLPISELRVALSQLPAAVRAVGGPSRIIVLAMRTVFSGWLAALGGTGRRPTPTLAEQDHADQEQYDDGDQDSKCGRSGNHGNRSSISIPSVALAPVILHTEVWKATDETSRL